MKAPSTLRRTASWCRIYDGTKWSDQTYTLYNGSAGEVTGMDAELLADGTAAVAFSVQNGGSSDIYYTLVDTAAENPEDAAVTIRATADGSRDEKPQLTTAGGQFVLGWSSVRTLTGAEQRDVGLRVFGKNGAPQSGLPESLSDMVSAGSFDGRFALAEGAESLNELTVLWNDAGAGGESNDVIRAVRFVSADGGLVSSAPLEVARSPRAPDSTTWTPASPAAAAASAPSCRARRTAKPSPTRSAIPMS